MNAAHFHLLVNHLPIIFPIIGALILIVGLIAKSNAVQRTAFMIFILGSIAAIIAMNTGEGAEDVVEKIAGVSKDLIKTHEEIAEKFSILTYALGGLSLVGLWANFKQKSFSKTVSYVVLLFAFVTIFFATQTGTTGGEIRHTEIRDGNTDTVVEGDNKHNKKH